MLFIHQQIQSFLNLGGCKEYFTMPKPKFPRKTNDAKEAVPITTSAAPASDTKVAPAEAMAAPPATKNRKTETRTETKKTARKPEIVKAEPRSNLVPINLEDEIRSLAYLLAERRGFEPGHEAEDWLAAETELRHRYHQQRA
jgi:hypothetical protein